MTPAPEPDSAGAEPRLESVGTEPAAGGEPPRRTRFRRFVVRPLVWAVAVVALLVAGAMLLLRTALFRERVRTLLTTQLGDILGRTVTIGGLDLELFPLAVEVRDVSIAGPTPADPPFAEVPRLLIEGELSGLKTPVLRLRTIELDSPVLRFEIGADGVSTVPKLRAGGGQRRRLEIEVGSLTIRNGALEFAERRLPLDLAAREVGLDLLATAEGTLAGRLEVRQMDLVLPKAQPYQGRLTARIAVDPSHLEVTSANLSGPDLNADLGGEVEWTDEPSAEFRIAAAGSSDLFVRLGYSTDQIEGPWRFAGDMRWQPGGLTWQGAVGSDALRVLNWPLTAVQGQARGDARTVQLDLERAGYREGTLRGTIDVDISQSSRPTNLALELAGVDAAAALADLQIPVTAVASRLNGEIAYRFNFDAPDRGDGELDLALAAAPDGTGALPLSGAAPFRLARGVLRTEALRLEAPGQQVSASGQYDLAAKRGRFDWQVETSAAGALAVLLPPPDPGEPAPAWIPARGRGTLSGALLLGPGGVSADVTLALADVVAPGLTADSATGTLRASERAIEDLALRFTRPGGELTVAGNVPLLPGGGALALVVDASAWPLAEARPWLPEEIAAWPLDGAFTGRVTLAGTLEAPSGTVDARLEPAVLGTAGSDSGLELDRVEARFAFDPQRVTLERVAVLMPAGEITASGSVGLADDRLELAVRSSGLSLGAAPFADLFGGGKLSGMAVVEADVGGTQQRPSVRSSVRATELALAGQPLGEAGSATVTVDWDGETLRAEGMTLGLIQVSGGGALTLERADLRFSLQTDALPRLADLLTAAPIPEFTGSTSGELSIVGPFTGGAIPEIELRLPELRLGYLGRTLRAREPVVVRLDRKGLALVSLYLSDSGTQEQTMVAGAAGEPPPAAPSGSDSELFMNGTVAFGAEGSGALDLHVQASIAASWLGLVAPTLQPFGTFEALATIKGTAAEPLINGQGGVRDGRLIMLGFPHALEDMNATVLFYSDALVLDSFTARLGGGNLQASGRFDFPREGAALAYRAQATARNVTLRYPEGWLISGDAELVLTSAEDLRHLNGEVVLDRAYYLTDVKVGVADLLRSALAPSRAQVAETDEFLANTQLSVAVRAADAVRVRNNLANLRGDADLVVRGTLAQPAVFGRVEIDSGGTLVYGENEYKVERALITFANPYRLEPFVDVVATTEVESYDVSLNLSGTLERLNVTFTSDPPIADLEILSLLATGDASTLGDVPASAESASLTTGGAEAFLAGQAANLIGERVNRLFGFDKFQVAPLQVGGDAVSSVRVTVGKRLGKDVFATYSVDPSGTLDNYLTVEWRINPTLSLVLTQTGDGGYGVDARWEKVF